MSALEDTLVWQCAAAGLPAPEREVRWHPSRKWRADLLWPTARLIVEVDGGVWHGGRHTTGAGFSADCEKLNEATLAGFRILRVTGDMVQDGRALAWLERALAGEETTP